MLIQERKMSVRATERLIGDVVVVTAMPKSPQMVVQIIEEKSKIITTVWFSPDNEFQKGTFPAAALDRAEAKKPPQTKKRPKKR
jgi:hypothetical protein